MSKIRNCGECPLLKETLFINLDPHQLAEIDAVKTQSSYNKGETIIGAKTRLDGFLCLSAGSVVVTDNDSGKSAILESHQPGAALGLENCFGQPPNVEVQAREFTRVCHIDKAVVDKLLATPRFRSTVLAQMADNLSSLRERMTNLHRPTAMQRVADAILCLYTNNPDARWTRREIASMANTSTETVIRLIGKLVEKGVVSNENRKLKILDIAGLKNLARN